MSPFEIAGPSPARVNMLAAAMDSLRASMTHAGVVAMTSLALAGSVPATPEQEAVGAGIECEARPGNLNLCDNRRTGTIALVNVQGLDGPAAIPFTDTEVAAAGRKATDLLFAITDGGVNLTTKVYTAPTSVTTEVAQNRSEYKDKPCIEAGGNFTASKVAVRQMAELADAQYVIAVGGASCPGKHYDQGKQVEWGAAGVAHVDNKPRLVDVYNVSGNDPNREHAVEGAKDIIVHEQLHLEGLGHVTAIKCDDDHNPWSPGTTTDMDVVIGYMQQHPKSCVYSEYGGHGLDPRPGNEYITALQNDYISGRVVGQGEARTATDDRPNGVTLIRPSTTNHKEPYGLISPLKEPITFSWDNGEGGTFSVSFTDFVIDYAPTTGSKHYVRLYLANNPKDRTLGMIELGYLKVPHGGRTLKLGDKTFMLQPTSDNTCMHVTTHAE